MVRRQVIDLSDEELVLAAADENPEAFEPLVDRYKSEILNFIFRYLKDFQQAEDAAQDVFVRAYRNLSKFQPEKARFKTWLFIIARNVARTAVRGRKLLLADAGEEGNQFDDYSSEDPVPSEQAADRELYKDTMIAMRNLSDDEREVVRLHLLHGLRLSEVADATESPLTTVCYRYKKALERLKGALSEHASSKDNGDE